MKLSEQVATLLEAQELAVIEDYAKTSMTVRKILEKHDISYNKLYRILRDSRTPLRQPHGPQITVLDKDNDNAPTLVDRTPATLRLRRIQLETAYYVRQEEVAYICSTFHISWRTLYRICSPNRRKLVIPAKPSPIVAASPDKRT